MAWINPKIKPGEVRKVLTGIPGKTGIVYTLDRQTGEFLWARPTTPQNVVSKIDGATGEVTVNPEASFSKAGEERLICPGMNGGKNFPAGAYSPLNNAIFMPVQNACMLFRLKLARRFGNLNHARARCRWCQLGVAWCLAAIPTDGLER